MSYVMSLSDSVICSFVNSCARLVELGVTKVLGSCNVSVSHLFRNLAILYVGA